VDHALLRNLVDDTQRVRQQLLRERGVACRYGGPQLLDGGAQARTVGPVAQIALLVLTIPLLCRLGIGHNLSISLPSGLFLGVKTKPHSRVGAAELYSILA
jgi:hypothetical protein